MHFSQHLIYKNLTSLNTVIYRVKIWEILVVLIKVGALKVTSSGVMEGDSGVRERMALSPHCLGKHDQAS